MFQPVVAVRGAAFALELDTLYAINVRRAAFSIKEVAIGMPEDKSTLDGAGAGNAAPLYELGFSEHMFGPGGDAVGRSCVACAVCLVRRLRH